MTFDIYSISDPSVHPGQQLALERVEPLIHGRLANIKSAFMAVDGHGTGMVSRVEFRRVLKSLLPVSDTQLLTGLNEVRSFFLRTCPGRASWNPSVIEYLA